MERSTKNHGTLLFNILHMNHKWEIFFREKIEKIFSEKKYILDIGGGLRVDKEKNNRSNTEQDWIFPLLSKVDYKVMDKVPDYHPDVVGDIHAIPLPDNSVDAIICSSVLEHVEEPQKAMKEIYRVLKPGGYCFLYVPFLYYYHPMKGYYKDFYRFTYDGVEYITRDFSSVEIQNVRGAVSTAMNLFPFLSKKTGVFDFIDRLVHKDASKQTSGYNVFCVK